MTDQGGYIVPDAFVGDVLKWQAAVLFSREFAEDAGLIERDWEAELRAAVERRRVRYWPRRLRAAIRRWSWDVRERLARRIWPYGWDDD